jgi:hypothetical protein
METTRLEGMREISNLTTSLKPSRPSLSSMPRLSGRGNLRTTPRTSRSSSMSKTRQARPSMEQEVLEASGPLLVSPLALLKAARHLVLQTRPPRSPGRRLSLVRPRSTPEDIRAPIVRGKRWNNTHPCEDNDIDQDTLSAIANDTGAYHMRVFKELLLKALTSQQEMEVVTEMTVRMRTARMGMSTRVRKTTRGHLLRTTRRRTRRRTRRNKETQGRQKGQVEQQSP